MKNNITAQTLDAQIMSLSHAINQQPIIQSWPPQMQCVPEWQGADLKITSDLTYRRHWFFDGNLLIIQTKHARELTWLLVEIRDAFSELITFENKYEFYRSLGAAAQKHLAEASETTDPRPLLGAVLAAAFKTIPHFFCDEDVEYTPPARGRLRMSITQWLQADGSYDDNKMRN